MKYGMTSYISRKVYETDRASIEYIMRDEAQHRARREGWTPKNITVRWGEAGPFGQPDPDFLMLSWALISSYWPSSEILPGRNSESLVLRFAITIPYNY